MTLLPKVIFFCIPSQSPMLVKISREYCPTGTSSFPSATRCTESVPTSLKSFTPAGFPLGTTSTTRFSSRLIRVPSRTKSSFFSFLSDAMSSWFICFCDAEMKRSQTAPSSIWVLSVPDESKLNVSFTSGSAFL